MNLSDQFPVLGKCTYLNTANSGLLSTSIANWRKKHDEEFMDLGSEFRLNTALFFQSIRENLARLFKAKSENTYLVPNFSFGLNTFLDGLESNHTFLLLSGDYPSVNYPITSRGFQCDFVEIGTNLEKRILDKIREIKPSIFAFSLVQYVSGIKLSESFLKNLKSEFPNLLLIADGTQFCGTAPFNFENSALDVLISSSYKWMLGGYGNGFVFIKNDAKNFIYKNRKINNLPTEPFLQGKDHLLMCFEPGHLDTLSFGSLNQSIHQLEALGLDYIENTTQSLTQKAKIAFMNRGLLADAVIERAEHSTILSLSLTPDMLQRIQKANIICSARGAGTRFSFHYYNTENELDKLIEAIDGK
ncbi:aminotransferase class V-fold PLP-dependent enzyme [Pedobacter fastidiosus]|uniref:Aminotransferase class V-fold PLP-dependent enzyme n=1 Tax=Pedobacter fastidiosus TaxID=2765361 RepID=A0ABR7KV79_9SPHI|nr:aminotransferase class V-fold PLP-dependent enzyme [Pedobacter fastidiosus]MBC6111940.1 aminotransferase class V-fold PLP-dependent enzyme [Pedobacter fastidiosus]